MAEPFVFDPRCHVCKTPFGAVPCGESFTLHVRPLAHENFNRCILVLHREFAGTESEYDMTCDGPEAERVRFSITMQTPESRYGTYSRRLLRMFCAARRAYRESFTAHHRPSSAS